MWSEKHNWTKKKKTRKWTRIWVRKYMKSKESDFRNGLENEDEKIRFSLEDAAENILQGGYLLA